MKATTHIVGPYHHFGDTVRQRCSWCGKMLVTYTYGMSELRTWPEGSIVSESEGAVWQSPGWSIDRDACFNPARLDISDFERYCAERDIPIGKENEAFAEWLEEKR